MKYIEKDVLSRYRYLSTSNLYSIGLVHCTQFILSQKGRIQTHARSKGLYALPKKRALRRLAITQVSKKTCIRNICV